MSRLRSLVIANRHPRLRLDRAAVTKAIRLLDAQFAMLPHDLPRLTLPRDRLAALKSQSKKPKAKILGACPPGELSLVFLTDAAQAGLHAEFLADPTTTDVITFEGNPALGFAGEICVSVDTAAGYARRHRGKFSRELLLYVVHGWLHLAGYDDRQPAKKRRMRAAEARALRLLNAAGLGSVFSLRD
ncbi:MAG TPA: rRNA maturation RNase YbeY [Opitutaceae bacterium]|nr:rRNA maturation RNase YbeY [Opitutaceae bacterium]HRJ47071.1 rRNA maturation RNase YbeY [Opitutaceae bacterium]